MRMQRTCLHDEICESNNGWGVGVYTRRMPDNLRGFACTGFWGRTVEGEAVGRKEGSRLECAEPEKERVADETWRERARKRVSVGGKDSGGYRRR